MIVAGVDVGAATAKTVIMDESHILSYCIIPTGYNVTKAAEEATGEALAKAGVSLDDLAFVVSTGYGRHGVPFSKKAVSEIICHAKGANLLIPETRAIIDIGGQDSKVIGIDERGLVANFVMNDKCAAGTGRFLEVMAVVLGLSIEDMGPTSRNSKDPCHISSTCTIFAETEMVSLRAEGRSREDLVAGIHQAIARRIFAQATSIKFEKDTVFTGGVAKNVGVKDALEDKIGFEILIPEEPQIMGALGAAFLAKSEAEKGEG